MQNAHATAACLGNARRRQRGVKSHCIGQRALAPLSYWRCTPDGTRREPVRFVATPLRAKQRRSALLHLGSEARGPAARRRCAILLRPGDCCRAVTACHGHPALLAHETEAMHTVQKQPSCACVCSVNAPTGRGYNATQSHCPIPDIMHAAQKCHARWYTPHKPGASAWRGRATRSPKPTLVRFRPGRACVRGTWCPKAATMSGLLRMQRLLWMRALMRGRTCVHAQHQHGAKPPMPCEGVARAMLTTKAHAWGAFLAKTPSCKLSRPQGA